jgi:hypothetical protein
MVKTLISKPIEKHKLKEYSGRPLRRASNGKYTYACDGCRETSLSGIYGPVNGKDVWLCADCFKPILNRRKKQARAAVSIGEFSRVKGRGRGRAPSKARTRS